MGKDLCHFVDWETQGENIWEKVAEEGFGLKRGKSERKISEWRTLGLIPYTKFYWDDEIEDSKGR